MRRYRPTRSRESEERIVPETGGPPIVGRVADDSLTDELRAGGQIQVHAEAQPPWDVDEELEIYDQDYQLVCHAIVVSIVGSNEYVLQGTP